MDKDLQVIDGPITANPGVPQVAKGFANTLLVAREEVKRTVLGLEFRWCLDGTLVGVHTEPAV